jgi:uncharacterized membrane protein YjjP (DUF1212 family)
MTLSAKERTRMSVPQSAVPQPAAPPPAGTEDGPPANAHTVLDLAMRVGDALLTAGMSANDVVVLMLRITRAYGMRRVHVDLTYTSISASYYPDSGGPPTTSLRIVQGEVVDYTRVRRLDRLCIAIEGGLSLNEAVAAFDRIRAAPRPYPRIVSTLGNAAVGPAVSLLFTTSWKVMLITFLTNLALDRILTGLDRRRVPPFFQNFAAAGLVTGVAAGITYAGKHGVAFFAGVDPTLVVVGGIILLVAGMMIVGAVQDAIDEFYVTASARVLEVVLRTSGIVAGIAVGLRVAQQVGAPLTISARPVALGPVGYTIAGAALIAACYALWAYADAITIALAAVMALLGWMTYTTMRELNAGDILANASGALVAALVTTLLVRRTSVPGFGLTSAALLPLVPGLALYNGLLQLVGTSPDTADPSAGGAALLLAFGVALGIGAGASLGTFLGRPIAEQLRHIPFRRRRNGG